MGQCPWVMGCCHLSTVTPWWNAPHLLCQGPGQPFCSPGGPSITPRQRREIFPFPSILQTFRVPGLSTPSDNYSPSPLTRVHRLHQAATAFLVRNDPLGTAPRALLVGRPQLCQGNRVTAATVTKISGPLSPSRRLTPNTYPGVVKR